MNWYQKGIKLLWISTLGFIIGVGVLMFLANAGVFGELPDLYAIKNPKPKLASEVYSEDSVLLGKFYHKYDRIQTEFHEISLHVVEALISTEDERFYEHAGIDFRSLFRAIFFLGSQGGASTITQQLAKNIFTDQAEKGVSRIFQKLKEWIIAIKLEKNFSKQEILTLYLNTVPFGDNVYGIRNAALTFYQKQPYNLRIDEAAVLVGLLKSNTYYNPRLYPEESKMRRNIVLQQMYKNKYLSKQRLDSIQQLPIKLNYLKLDEKEGIATYFREHVRNQVQAWINRYRTKTGKTLNLYQDGLKIYTTINSKMQAYAEQSVQNHIAKMQLLFDEQLAPIQTEYWNSLDSLLQIWVKQSDRYKALQIEDVSEEEVDKIFKRKIPMSVFSWRVLGFMDTLMSPLDSIKYHKKMLQVGALFVNPSTGKVKAWVGGTNFKVFKYDHVNVAKRQVGSTIKPLLYALAMEQYGFKPETFCSNMSQCFGNVSDSNQWCTQNNPGSRNDSITSFLEGIVFSLNNVSAFIIKQVSPQSFANFLRDKLLIKSKVFAVPSLCLGTSEFSLYEMIRAYTIFPTNGMITDLQTITKIADAEGRVLERFGTPSRNIVLSENTAYSMSEIMQGTVNYGTARRIRYMFDIKGDIAGKTGTTNDFSDAWFMGFNRELLGGVWVGCEDKIISFRSREGEGSSMALPIFGNFWLKSQNDKALNFTTTPFQRPLGADSSVKKKVNILSRKGLEAYLAQNPDANTTIDKELYKFVLEDPQGKRLWNKDSLAIDSTNTQMPIIATKDKNEDINNLIKKEEEKQKLTPTKNQKPKKAL